MHASIFSKKMLLVITLNPLFKVSLRCKGKFFPVFTLRRK